MVMLSTENVCELTKINNMDEFRETPVGKLIYDNLSSVVHNATVWNAFLKWSTLSHNEAVLAVVGGTLPYVVVEDSFFTGSSFGCFRPGQPNNIRLNRGVANDAKNMPINFMRTGALQDVEVTLLHELVHWGRHWNGAPQMKYRKDERGQFVEDIHGGTIDVGKRFELEAYPLYYFPTLMPTTTKISHFDYQSSVKNLTFQY